MALEDEILEKITPNAQEKDKAMAIVTDVMQKIRNKANSLGIEAEPILVGSVAKDTALALTDIDIFIMFPPEVPVTHLEKYGLEIGESIVHGERRYAQHPYAHGQYDGYTLDIVPCYRIKDTSQKMTAVDRTPFHTEYVKKNLASGKKGDVRLLKQFMKGIGAYGADAKVQGFSGYVCEILVIRFGSFTNVLEAAKSWHRGTILRLEGHHPPKFNDPLVIIDPIDPTRNAAAAVSPEKLALFVHASAAYLDHKTSAFFFPSAHTPKHTAEMNTVLSRRGTTLAGLIIERPKVVDDILYSQIKKCEKAIVQLLDQHGFRTASSGYFVQEDDLLFIFELEVAVLPDLAVHLGPPVWHQNSMEFLSKWREAPRIAGPYISGDRWAVDISREMRTAVQVMESRLLQAGLGKDLNEKVAANKYEVITQEELLSEKYVVQVSEFLDKRFPWDR